jgi:hypothetical protein
MARGRLISKTLGTSSRRFVALGVELGRLGEFGQALFPLLIANADDFGRLDGDSFTVKHSVWATSPRSYDDFGRALTAMAKVGLIVLYEHEGRMCLQINDFDTHQPGLHKRTASRFPEPPGISRKVPEIPAQQNRTEQNLTEQKRDGDSASPGDGFSEFWLAYPRKDGKRDAEKVWRTLKPDEPTRAAILGDVQRRIRSEPWQKERGKFIPHAKTYLRGARWQDEGTKWNTSRTSGSGSDWCNHEPRCDHSQQHIRRLVEEDRATRPASAETVSEPITASQR